MSISLKLFGGFSARDASGKELSLRTRKIRALFAYLAVNADKPQPRDRLMSLLWSDRSERQARQSLNQALVAIRRVGEDVRLLDSNGERITLHGDAISSDVERMRSLAVNHPANAADLYGGPFLDGFSIPDPAFEEWLRATRSELQSLACKVLERAAAAAEDQGNVAEAILNARRLNALEPLNEDAHRRLMRLLHRSGDRALALRQYQTCAKILREELDVEPDARTRQLFDEIRGETAQRDPSHKQTPEPLAGDVGRSWQSKPSIAVLRFEDIGGDSSAKLIADGLTEDVITALARVPDLVVIAGDTIGVPRDKASGGQDVTKNLGANCILQGSIRTHDDRLRCSVRLSDASRGHHLWAERYDREIDDIFALQDEIVRHVLIELQVKLTEGDSARIASLGTRNLEAWLLRVQGAAELNHVTPNCNARARAFFAAAHRADPHWARPLSSLASCDFYDARNGWSASREESIAMGIEDAKRATEMDPNDPFGYVMLKLFNLLLGNYDEALVLIRKAVSLAPNDTMALGNLATQLLFMNQVDRAIEIYERVLRMAPMVPTFHQRHYGLALHVLGRTDRAITVLEKLARFEPKYLEGLVQLAAVYVSAGRIDAARATVEKIREQDPTYSSSTYISNAIYFQDAEQTEWLRALLIEAGLP